ncbi:mucin-4 [Patella vulgata]|uniref:mucin-4 n=1 Tax=Patella vulgata TaxID=6465 RepID=UPI0024A92692|nr:mucin-4 [Patella vulgata]
MNQDCSDVNDRNNDLVNNNCPQWQKIDSENSEVDGSDGQHQCVYNENEGGKNLIGNNGIEMTTRPGDAQAKRKLGNIEERIETSVSLEGKDRISNILGEVSQLSDVEKLLLYLKLPTGSATEEVLRQTPNSFLHSSNRVEQAQAFTWIRSHLEEDGEICVPKHEVYDDYKEYCDSHDRKFLCPADFGKVMKCVFPNVKARRLGQRGQSRYCYSGLRKKLEVQPPSLPELEVSSRKIKDEGSEEDELFLASCQLVCEWAQKLLGSHFNSLGELSEYLVGNHYVNSKSMAAFTVLAAMQDSGMHSSKVPVSMLFSSPSNGNKHRETQLQLQRKLQEREILKEQKKILQQQKYENEQEHEQLIQSRGLILSPKNLKQSFQGKGAARDISKLLQSPNSDSSKNRRRSLSDSQSNETNSATTNGRNTVDISVLNSAKQKTTEPSEPVIMCSDSATVVNVGKDNYPITSHNNIFTNTSLSTCESSSSSQQPYSVVQKRSVIQVIGHKSDENKNITRGDSQAMDTNEKENITQYSNYAICVDNSAMSNENSIIILPSTPSTRSAFVPVSNQRKESAFSNDPSVSLGVTLSEKIQNDQEMTYDILKSENTQQITLDSSSGSQVSSTVQSKSLSPQTPRKSKNRFTPIKPKVTPTKTSVSQKPPAEAPTYDSRPVAAILKEKRAKEAQEVRTHFTTIPTPQATSTVTGSLPVVAPQILRIPASAAGTKTNDVLIILGSSAQQSMTTKNSTIVSPCQTVTTTAITSMSTHNHASSKENSGILTFYPASQNQMKRSSNISTVRSSMEPTTITTSTIVSSQEYVRPTNIQPNISQSSKNSTYTEMSEISFNQIENSCKQPEMTMMEVSKSENDTLNRKRKSSDQGSALISKKTNSMMESKQKGETSENVNQSKHGRSINQSCKLVSKGVTNSHAETNIQLLSNNLNLESLEHDALLDSNSVAVDKNLCQSVNRNSKTETSSIGISAKSLRPSQKQLMKEKMQLDERIHNFLNKLVDVDPPEVSKSVDPQSKKPEKQKQGSCHPVNLLSLLKKPIKLDNPNLLRSIHQPAKSLSKEPPSPLPSRSIEARMNMDYIPKRRNEDFTQSKIVELLGRPKNKKIKDEDKKPEKEVEHTAQMECVETLDKLDTKCGYNDNTDEGELPSDVAEFVTEALTARAQSRASNYSTEGADQSFNDSTCNLSNKPEGMNADLIWTEPPNVTLKTTEKDQQEPFIVPNTPPIRQNRPEYFNAKYKLQPVQRSISMPVFTVPSNPQQPQSFPAQQPNVRIEAVSPVNAITQKPISPHDFTTPPRKPIRRQRQHSVEQFKNQTLISDAGYHSFNTSPVMNSTPVPSTEVTLVSESYIGRSESSHSITTDQQIVSPISHTSPHPRPSATSTPSSIMSPHCLSQGSINQSPVEYIGSPNAFMPIQGMSTGVGPLINPRIVTPIRPVVTLAEPSMTGTSAASATANQLLNIMKKAPGLTKAALQTHQRLLAQQLDPSGFVSLNPSSFNNRFVITNTNGDTVPPNLSLINAIRLQSESPIQRSPSVSCSTPDDDMIIVSPKPKENISHQRSSSNSRTTSTETSTLPTYEEALKQIGRTPSSKKHNPKESIIECVTPVVVTTSSDSSQLLTRILTGESNAQENTSEPVLSKEYPFSYQLALLHEKIQTPLPVPISKQVSVSSEPDKVFFDNLSDLIGTLDSPTQFTVASSLDDINSNFQTVSGKILIDSRSDDVRKSQNLLPSELQVNGQISGDQLAGLYPAYDLPNVNYIGSAPNIDLSNILHKPSTKSTPVFCDNNQTVTKPIVNDNSERTNDSDLPPYMDILSLGGQYFSKAELDVENLHSTLPSSSETISSDQPHYRSETLSS